MVTLVLAALGVLSALALADAVHAWRAAEFAADDVRARAGAITALTDLRSPSDVPWLCLQPPHAVLRRDRTLADGVRVEVRWWSVAAGEVRGQVTGIGPRGARRRWLGQLVPDSLPVDPWIPGCPDAQALRPAGPTWLMAHPDG